jgi:hypothetical protein
MAIRTRSQLMWRRRFDRGIRLAAPVLDLVLLAGGGLSRLAGRDDVEPEAPRHPQPWPPRLGAPPAGDRRRLG